jgi:DNA-binding GntR family transcriptional regulator
MGNELISQTYRINSLRVRLIHLERSTLSAEILLPAMKEHLNLIAALKARDAALVAQHLAFHIHSAHQRILGQDRRVQVEQTDKHLNLHFSSNLQTEFS